jgi:hypothetical protein
VRTEIDVPFGRSRGPEVKRDERFLDLRDEVQDLLHSGAPAEEEDVEAALEAAS